MISMINMMFTEWLVISSDDKWFLMSTLIILINHIILINMISYQ